MLVIDVTLFGVYGLIIWTIQMAWIPFLAAGVVNGIGHYFGYRNYDTADHSTNFFPIVPERHGRTATRAARMAGESVTRAV